MSYRFIVVYCVCVTGVVLRGLEVLLSFPLLVFNLYLNEKRWMS